MKEIPGIIWEFILGLVTSQYWIGVAIAFFTILFLLSYVKFVLFKDLRYVHLLFFLFSLLSWFCPFIVFLYAAVRILWGFFKLLAEDFTEMFGS